MSPSITVFIVDSDEPVRRALARLMQAAGFQAVPEESVESLLRRELPASEAVLLVDVTTARQSGASLHEQLDARGLNLPVIYLTDCDTEQSRRRAKRLGAVGYFRKPVDDHALLDAIFFANQRNPVVLPRAPAELG